MMTKAAIETNRLVNHVMECARRYVEELPPAIDGKGGHNTTFVVACVLVNGFMLDFADAKVIMREYNKRCRPPWSDADLDHKLRDAAKTPDKEGKGYLLPQCFEPPVEQDHKEEPVIVCADPLGECKRFLGDFRCDAEELRRKSPIRL